MVMIKVKHYYAIAPFELFIVRQLLKACVKLC